MARSISLWFYKHFHSENLTSHYEKPTSFSWLLDLCSFLLTIVDFLLHIMSTFLFSIHHYLHLKILLGRKKAGQLHILFHSVMC